MYKKFSVVMVVIMIAMTFLAACKPAAKQQLTAANLACSASDW